MASQPEDNVCLTCVINITYLLTYIRRQKSMEGVGGGIDGWNQLCDDN